MTVADARPAGPRHARPEPFIPGQRFTPVRAYAAPVMSAYEPPAGLGPWVPPLPAPERGMTRSTAVIVAGFVVALVIATIVMVAQNVHGAVTKVDATYLSAVRANSSLTASDTDLVTAGRTVCSALDQHPSRTGVVGVFTGLTQATGWSAGDAAAVVGSAVGAFCPEHRALIGR